MGLVAATLSVGAAALYPWPQRVDDNAQVNQKLFTAIDLGQARLLTITSFEKANRRFDSIQLKRVRDSWVLTASGDFPTGNAKRIADVFNVLSESLILEVKSSDESTHQLYGVIDPDQIGDSTSQTGIGTKVSLADNNNRSMAEMIIGEAVGGNLDQRFVRVAGQPNVYVIQLAASLLSTKLSDWVDHNLLDLKLTDAGTGLEVTGLRIDGYVLEGQSVTDKSPKKYNYLATVDLRDKTFPLSIAKPDQDGVLGEPIAGQKINPQTLGLVANNLSQVQFTAVGKKPSSASEALATGLDDKTDLKSLANFGFRNGTELGNWIESKNGQLVVSTASGVDWTLSLGSIAANANVSDAQINYYLIITAGTNTSAFPMPPEPSDPTDENLKKDYERALKRREDNLATVNELTKQYNERHAPWLYLISEDVLEALRPDENKLTQ